MDEKRVVKRYYLNLVKTIEKYAFTACEKLSEIHLTNNLTSFNPNAVINCYALKQIYFDGTKSEWNTLINVQKFPDDVPNDCKVICNDGELSITK